MLGRPLDAAWIPPSTVEVPIFAVLNSLDNATAASSRDSGACRCTPMHTKSCAIGCVDRFGEPDGIRLVCCRNGHTQRQWFQSGAGYPAVLHDVTAAVGG